jgi:hypothetical protein
MGQILDTQNNIASLKAAGVPDAQISGYGGRLSSTEASGILNAYKGQQMTNQIGAVQGQLAGLTSQSYQFDPNQYLPGIQNTANSIYSPQQAQLEAIRQLQNASATDTKLQTEKDFAKRMQQETEAINRRGAFFSGGAIQNEQDLRSQNQSQLFQQGLQASAADFGNQAQQAQLAAEKTQFIQDRLVNADSSAYARWFDNRSFSFQALQTQFTNLVNERNFARSVFESDRTFEQSQKQFEQTYAITSEQFDQAKKEFNVDMKIKNLSYDQALVNFKTKTANTNTGLFGNVDGKDALDLITGIANLLKIPVKNTDTTITTPTTQTVPTIDWKSIPGISY